MQVNVSGMSTLLVGLTHMEMIIDILNSKITHQNTTEQLCV